uniref:Uncharacterized protein n=1 Tax=Parascaris equorum TaxID=6256 RepID=A0A914S1H5_PAREQ
MDMEYQLILKIPLALITILEVLIAANIARQLYYKLRVDSLIDDRDKYRPKIAHSAYVVINSFWVSPTIAALLQTMVKYHCTYDS